MLRIFTERLELWQVTEGFLSHWLESGPPLEELFRELSVPGEWKESSHFIQTRRDQYRGDPEFRSWGVWAIVEPARKEMIGHIGFHTPPDPDYLLPYVKDAVEFGFTVFPECRGKGHATEAARGLIEWAKREKRQRHFIVSISPVNLHSIAVARKLGFQKIGSWEDPEDGLENVYLLELQA